MEFEAKTAKSCAIWIKRRISAALCSDFEEGVAHCSVDASGRHWTCSSDQSNFVCSVDDSGHKILCVDKHHCPYAEESHQISIAVFVRTEHFLVENYSKRFFLSEIGETSPAPWHNMLAVFCFVCFSFSSSFWFHFTLPFSFTLES